MDEPNGPVRDDDGDCTQCLHLWAAHYLITLAENAMEGGIYLCPEPRCQCYGTWSAGNHPMADPPASDSSLVMTLRWDLQRNHGSLRAQEQDRND